MKLGQLISGVIGLAIIVELYLLLTGEHSGVTLMVLGAVVVFALGLAKRVREVCATDEVDNLRSLQG
ncbi:hypothetical protein A2311_06765 [candidate division WOR-1 bacterium RIFOXYB2_FULL_48_7]|uniref:Uncharacterized protein n=1 Tax=candidate division WOR-1 bacterium RIFOXYB2_FULL_48_7 TaxID=1802583 RepID=A0A1F4T9M2_UNCSA|nr:MAG: hypothetical protein A2311_06765 [candidate division WOR-1 bacterium RIFOXYB2_FULL_48_7]